MSEKVLNKAGEMWNLRIHLTAHFMPWLCGGGNEKRAVAGTTLLTTVLWNTPPSLFTQKVL